MTLPVLESLGSLARGREIVLLLLLANRDFSITLYYHDITSQHSNTTYILLLQDQY